VLGRLEASWQFPPRPVVVHGAIANIGRAVSFDGSRHCGRLLASPRSNLQATWRLTAELEIEGAIRIATPGHSSIYGDLRGNCRQKLHSGGIFRPQLEHRIVDVTLFAAKLTFEYAESTAIAPL